MKIGEKAEQDQDKHFIFENLGVSQLLWIKYKEQ